MVDGPNKVSGATFASQEPICANLPHGFKMSTDGKSAFLNHEVDGIKLKFTVYFSSDCKTEADKAKHLKQYTPEKVHISGKLAIELGLGKDKNLTSVGYQQDDKGELIGAVKNFKNRKSERIDDNYFINNPNANKFLKVFNDTKKVWNAFADSLAKSQDSNNEVSLKKVPQPMVEVRQAQKLNQIVDRMEKDLNAIHIPAHKNSNKSEKFNKTTSEEFDRIAEELFSDSNLFSSSKSGRDVNKARISDEDTSPFEDYDKVRKEAFGDTSVKTQKTQKETAETEVKKQERSDHEIDDL